jgi:hypothetical protein
MNMMRAYFVCALLVAPVSPAQVAPVSIVQIRISSSSYACFIAQLEIRCSDVGATLLGMNVSTNANISLVGNRDVSYEMLRSILDSLMQAGYKLKVGEMVTR